MAYVIGISALVAAIGAGFGLEWLDEVRARRAAVAKRLADPRWKPMRPSS